MAALALAAAATPASAKELSFKAGDSLSSDSGHALIEWNASGPVTLELAETADFAGARRLYSGANHAYFISGLADGDYRIRLRGADGEVSAPVTLEVRHQSLRRALWLALVGAIVSVAIAMTILRGARDD